MLFLLAAFQSNPSNSALSLVHNLNPSDPAVSRSKLKGNPILYLDDYFTIQVAS